MTAPVVGESNTPPTVSLPTDTKDPVLTRVLGTEGRHDPREFATNSVITGKVRGQPDGDGANIQLSNGKWVATRLAYIDTPETDKPSHNKPGQPYSKEAMTYLHDLMKGKEITAKVVEPASEKNYWRPVVELYADGKNLNLAMLESGYAWPQKKYMPGDYAKATAAGYSSGNGIFSKFNPETPGAFRARLFSGMQAPEE